MRGACPAIQDFLSVDQKGPDGKRTKEEQTRFKQALEVMGSCYASITGTSVVLCKQVPTRPEEYNGKVVVWVEEPKLTDDGLTSDIEALLSEFGKLALPCKLDPKLRRVEAKFVEHKDATTAVNTLRAQGQPIDLWYNERAYDGDGGRGWPKFEQGASCTTAAYLMLAEREGILPMRFSLAQKTRPKVALINEHGDFEDVKEEQDPANLLEATISDSPSASQLPFTSLRAAIPTRGSSLLLR